MSLLHAKTFHGAGGVKLAADVGGDPAGQPIIFLHGAGQTRHSWSRAARDMIRRGYHVIALDLRGHGDSEWAPDGDYTLDAFAGDLRAVIATLQRPPAVVGASLGGVTALITLGAEGAPEARALVLVDVVPHLQQEGANRIHDFMSANMETGFATLEEAADAVASYLPHRPRPASVDGLRKNLRERDGRFYWHWDPRFRSARPPGFAEQMIGRMEKASRHIDFPTLLVYGQQSELVSEEGVARLRALIPHAECVDVAGARHMVAGDKNDAFNDAVEGFLQRVVATAPA